MYVSLDGASEETYKQYRVGGNFSLVLKNVKLLSNAKLKYGLKYPKLIWKFVIFNHNKHELNIVRKKYKKLGFDNYQFVLDNQSDTYRKSKQINKARLRKTLQGCFWLWHTMIIRWDGEVLPCCTPFRFNIGNAIHDNCKEIWRSKRYRAIRQGFSDKKNIKKCTLFVKGVWGMNQSIFQETYLL